jgi:hypothetical protein
MLWIEPQSGAGRRLVASTSSCARSRCGGPAPTSSQSEQEEALPSRCARQEGCSLHAGRQGQENDRVGLERLVPPRRFHMVRYHGIFAPHDLHEIVRQFCAPPSSGDDADCRHAH